MPAYFYRDVSPKSQDGFQHPGIRPISTRIHSSQATCLPVLPGYVLRKYPGASEHIPVRNILPGGEDISRLCHISWDVRHISQCLQHDVLPEGASGIHPGASRIHAGTCRPGPAATATPQLALPMADTVGLPLQRAVTSSRFSSCMGTCRQAHTQAHTESRTYTHTTGGGRLLAFVRDSPPQ